MNTRIFNTAFNNLASETTLGNKIKFTADALWAYKGPTNSIYNINYPGLYDSNIELNNSIIGNYFIINGQNKFYFDLSANRTLLWGDDSSNFVVGCINSFNLSDIAPGITDNITFNFAFETPNSVVLPNNVYLGNTGTSTDYVTFNGSYTSVLFPSGTSPTVSKNILLTITDFTPGQETCTFNWS
jgi:hypothetical protein